MIRLLILSLFFVFVVICSASAADIIYPFNQGNRFTPLFMFLTPTPDSPDLPSENVSMSVLGDYSSIFINEDSDEWEAVVDLEYTTITFILEAKVFDLFSLKAETAFVSMYDGFMDGFLEEYHDAGHFPDYGRMDRPHNEFVYFIKAIEGDYWFQASAEGFQPADTVLSVKVPVSVNTRFSFLSDYRFSSTIQYSLKIPTGDKSQGLGSGGFDHGFFYLTKLTKDRFTYFLSPGLILLEAPETPGLDIPIKNMGTLFGGVVFSYDKNWQFSAQLNCFSSPYDFNIDAFDLPGIELTCGFRHRFTKNTSVECTFSEDLLGVVPDFTLHTGWHYNF